MPRFWTCFSTAFLNCGLSRVCFFSFDLKVNLFFSAKFKKDVGNHDTSFS
ncbi:hypothetical protein DsansV1_C10g0100821 [Dioscorea sansibarensis]